MLIDPDQPLAISHFLFLDAESEDDAQCHPPDRREADLEFLRKGKRDRMGGNPEPEQGFERAVDALEAPAAKDEIVFDPVEKHHLGTEEDVREHRDAERPGESVGRITSYNVCYTKLLRIGLPNTPLEMLGKVLAWALLGVVIKYRNNFV